MKALVTGAAGFIGRHMTAELINRGYQVARCDLTLGWDALDVFRTSSTHYDLIVHAAASSPHREAIDRQPVHMARNLQLDAAMFDWAVRTDQGRVLYLSSSAAYPIDLQEDFSRPILLKESDIRVGDRLNIGRPDAAYGWTKLTGEMLADTARSSGLQVTVVRPFSGYGEDQSYNFPFRAIVERARTMSESFAIWGDGSQVRDWIHVDDVIAAALAVVESGTTDPINLCTGIGHSMLELAQMACAAVGLTPVFEFRLDKPSGVAHRAGDPMNMHRYYTPAIPLAEGVERALSALVTA